MVVLSSDDKVLLRLAVNSVYDHIHLQSESMVMLISDQKLSCFGQIRKLCDIYL
jgi:hypothetical protein